MQDRELIGKALGLGQPWFVALVELDMQRKRLDIELDFPSGSRFACPVCTQGEYAVYDSRRRTWRHLDFFQYKAYLHARLPRISCPACGVKQVGVPWAREGSGFTLLFEALVLQLAEAMPVTAAAAMARVHADSIWRILKHYVDQALAAQDLSEVTVIGLDECSKQKGHQYITTFCDLEDSSVLYVTEGKDANTVAEFAEHLVFHGGHPAQITQACADMSKAYIAGIGQYLPSAQITFDRYHIMALVNKAVDNVRRAEQKEQPTLKNSRYVWLKNPDNLTKNQRCQLLNLKGLDTKTARAYHLKLALQRLWAFFYPKAAERYLRSWYFWATHSKLTPMIEAAKTIKRHWHGILAFIKSRITNGIVEGINSKIKTALKRAYGFKSFDYYRTIIYLVAGKLNLLPTQC
jgi:transposase